MKIAHLILIFFACATPGFAQNTSNIAYCKDISEIERVSAYKKLNPPSVMATNNYDIVFDRCYWELDPAVNYIKGNITTYFKPTITGFNQIEFDLTDSLTVDSIHYHNSNISFSHSNNLIQISLPGSVLTGVPDSITIFYQGVPNSSGMGSFIQDQHNGTPIIWTLSEPYGAIDWWPCKQNLSDKIDSIDIIVKVPAGNRVGSNGILVSAQAAGPDSIFHWQSRYPIATYLVAIAVTNYSQYNNYVPLQSGDTLKVLNYVYPENLVTALTETPYIVDIIKFYDSLTIDYPFANEKYGHAQFNWGGGMEHQTMTFVSDFGTSLMAHECAHHWFGDHVTCGSWEDIWLNEGFATYFDGLTVQRYFPGDWQAWKDQRISIITSNNGGSVLCDDTTNVARIFDGRLSYNKGAYLLHMLRWKLGNTNFFNALKNYLNDPALKQNFAKTSDLKAHLEAVSGMDLNGFFDQWYYNQGFPSYQVSWTQNADKVSVTINQTQSHSSVSFFAMPVPIRFVGDEIDTTIVFDHTFSGQTFNCTVNFPTLYAQFDPELWLLSANNTISGKNESQINENEINLYPNPTEGKLHIHLKKHNQLIKAVEIFDPQGKLLFHDEYSNKTVNLDISTLSKGVYVLKIYSTLGIYNSKIVRE